MRLGASFARSGCLLLACLTTARCGGAPPRPNVILIVVDALRADALSGSGAAPDATPQIARFASAGVRFDRAVAQASWTVPSLASLMTSRYPAEHGQGALGAGEATRLVTLAESMRAQGYRTAAFAEIEFDLLKRGFAAYQMPAGDTASRYREAALDRPTPTFERAAEWLRSRQPAPFFLFVHTYGVHDYYLGKPRQRARALRGQAGYAGPLLAWRPRPPAEAVGNLIMGALLAADEKDLAYARGLYAAGVAEADAEVGRLLGVLDEMGLARDTVVVLTSDHGEGFDPKRHRVHHGGRLHEDLLRVPLIVRWTGHIVPWLCHGQVQLVDVAPTLSRLAGAPVAEGARGRPLFRARPRWLAGTLYEPSVEPRPALAEESALRITPSGLRETSSVRQIAFYRDALKLVRTGQTDALYDLARDPYEDADLARTRPGLARSMSLELEKLKLFAGTPADGLRPDVIETLRSLGYIR